MEENHYYQSPIIAGSLIILFFVVFPFISPFEGEVARLVQGVMSLILRVVVIIWIVNLANQQRRKALPFVLLGAIIPALTLIIMGQIGDKNERFDT